MGVEYKEEKVGNLADISVFSLHPRKFISRYAFEHCLTLPLYHEMMEEEQEDVIGQVTEVNLKLKGKMNNHVFSY